MCQSVLLCLTETIRYRGLVCLPNALTTWTVVCDHLTSFSARHSNSSVWRPWPATGPLCVGGGGSAYCEDPILCRLYEDFFCLSFGDISDSKISEFSLCTSDDKRKGLTHADQYPGGTGISIIG